MTPEQERAEASKALEAATPGPWLYDEPIIWTVEDGEPTDKPQGYWSVIGGQPSGQICIIDELEKRADAHLIANAPEWLRNSLDREEQLIVENNRLLAVNQMTVIENAELIAENKRLQKELDKAEQFNMGAWTIADDLANKLDMAVEEIDQHTSKVAEQDKEIQRLRELLGGKS